MQGRENIIKTYKLIHKYFFKYAIFGITILIGTLIFQSFLKRNALNLQTNGDNHSLIIKEKELIGAFEKQLKQNIESDGVQVKIIQGYMSNSGDYIESSNNLATYK